MIKKTHAWVVSLRLRTLPLAIASTGMGSFLAAGFGVFNLRTCILAALTAILLQILSNLANDYGDFKKGTDNADRVGPQRALQTGIISVVEMRNAVIFVAVLTLISGCTLLYFATNGLIAFIVFLVIGLLSIVGAIKYTMGKKPYGYSGWGDLAVFIFFGVIGVGGTFYLHSHYLHLDIFLPAGSVGFLSAAVLNVNNMRDINNDEISGKRTLAVILGLKRAKTYHLFLILVSINRLVRFTFLHVTSNWQWAFLATIPFFILHIINIYRSDSAGMDKYLKQLAIFTLILVLCFGISISMHPYV